VRIIDMQHSFFENLEVPRNEKEARFLEFHKNNPKVYDLFDHFTRQAIESGYDRIGARLILERIRWEANITTKDKDFKLNDHYIAYYARRWMKQNPKHKGLFKTKPVQGE
tara:strand:+ start:100 stop:429 length:330 start_codon:yes stop_codon:yes gene_type:complete